jgi:DUF971 family protein
MMKKNRPKKIVLHQKSRVVEIEFDEDQKFELPCEYLRVYSPSAEVRGHGPGQEVLQYGKESVGIERIEPQGFYAVRLCFDDGHNTGIYSWDTLYELGANYETLWKDYLSRLEDAGHKRNSSKGDIPVVIRGPESKGVQ